jgi:hypothetical protein
LQSPYLRLYFFSLASCASQPVSSPISGAPFTRTPRATPRLCWSGLATPHSRASPLCRPRGAARCIRILPELKKTEPVLTKFYIHAPAKLKQDPATLTSTNLDSHGCKKCKSRL